MELKFTVSGRVSRPVGEVFEAVADPDRLSRYFTTGGARGRLEPGATVEWAFHDFPGAFPVEVIEVDPPRRIVLGWDAATGGRTRVTLTFDPLENGRTLVSITEEGWPETEGGLRAAFDNCGGWMQMLCALKAWTEYGVNLRADMFR